MTQRVCSLITLVALLLASRAQAQTFTTLLNFTVGQDGGYPMGGLISDQAGNVYGTTSYGGEQRCGEDGAGCGVVFKLDSAGRETVLHRFSDSPDGNLPQAAVARDKAGNIYGTTLLGGTHCAGKGYGMIFRIDKAGNETVLYSFTGGADGCDPDQGLVVDNSGFLYGTTSGCGGAYPYDGTIFKVDGAGNFTLLHSFTGSSDGAQPQYGHLTMDKSSNLYGVTREGGTYDMGAAYKLSSKGTLTLLHSFAGGATDGCNPFGSVVLDKAGNLYGTASGCGFGNAGVIWKVSKKGVETILHNFAGGTSDGCNPYAGVARDSKGNLYGVTYGCGANGDGALYMLSTRRRLNLLYSFRHYPDGSYPAGEVLRTATGTLFGTTYIGGNDTDGGTMWKYVP